MKRTKSGRMVAVILAIATALSLVCGTASAAWQKDNGVWRFINNGSKTTDWAFIGGEWYYFNASGDMQTGWVWDGEAWYYMGQSGAMQRDWIWDGEGWYFLNQSGAMQRGWVLDDGNWYYLGAGGKMVTGFFEVNGSTYFASSSGDMQSGFVTIDDAVYYFGDANDGAMKTGTVTVDGVVYTFDETGKGIGDNLPTPDKAFDESGKPATDATIPSEDDTTTTPDSSRPSTGGGLTDGYIEDLINSTIGVSTFSELEDAIANEEKKEIVVNDDITFMRCLTIPEGRTLTIDLNGYTFNDTGFSNYQILNQGNLTLKDGKMVADYESKRNIFNVGDLTLNNMELTGYYCVDNSSNLAANQEKYDILSREINLTVENSTLTSKFVGVAGYTNSVVNMYDSEIHSLWYAVAGNGTQKDATFNLYDSTLTSTEDVVIYMPSTKALNIENCTLTGYSGIELRAGVMNVVYSTIRATGPFVSDFDKPSDGSVIDGSALLVISRSPYDNGGTLEFYLDENTTLISDKGYGLRIGSSASKGAGVSEIIGSYYSASITGAMGDVRTSEMTSEDVTMEVTDLSPAEVEENVEVTE